MAGDHKRAADLGGVRREGDLGVGLELIRGHEPGQHGHSGAGHVRGFGQTGVAGVFKEEPVLVAAVHVAGLPRPVLDLALVVTGGAAGAQRDLRVDAVHVVDVDPVDVPQIGDAEVVEVVRALAPVLVEPVGVDPDAALLFSGAGPDAEVVLVSLGVGLGGQFDAPYPVDTGPSGVAVAADGGFLAPLVVHRQVLAAGLAQPHPLSGLDVGVERGRPAGRGIALVRCRLRGRDERDQRCEDHCDHQHHQRRFVAPLLYRHCHPPLLLLPLLQTPLSGPER